MQKFKGLKFLLLAFALSENVNAAAVLTVPSEIPGAQKIRECDLTLRVIERPKNIPQAVWNALDDFDKGSLKSLGPTLANYRVQLSFKGALRRPPVTGRVIGFDLAPSQEPGQANQKEVVVLFEGPSDSPSGKHRNAAQAYPLRYISEFRPISAPEPTAPTETSIIQEEELNRYFERVQGNYLRQSQANENAAVAATQRGSPIHTNAAAIGAGPNGLTVINAFHSAFPSSSNVVMEATSSFGTFNRMDNFDTNTIETDQDSGNTFPGAPFQPRALNPSKRRFVRSKVLGWVGLGTLKKSEATVLLENPVTHISYEPSKEVGKLGKVHVSTSKGIRETHDVVFVATGMGEPNIKVGDENTQAFIKEKITEGRKAMALGDPHAAPQIMTLDDFLYWYKIDQKEGRDPMARYGNGTFAIVGGGDGGNIGMEKMPDGRVTFWINQKAVTAEEFLAHFKDLPLKAERYRPIADKFEREEVDARQEILVGVNEVNDNGKTRIELGLSKDRTPPYNIETDPPKADHVILALGYKNNILKFFKDLCDDGDLTRVTLEPVIGRPDSFTHYTELHQETILGQQVFLDGTPTPIFIVGNAANPQISDRVDGIATGGYLDVLLARTAALGHLIGEQLAQQLHPETRASLQTQNGETVSSSFDLPSPEKPSLLGSTAQANSRDNMVFDSVISAELEFRVKISKILDDNFIAGPQEDGTDFDFEFRLNKNKASTIYQNLSKSTAELLGKILARDPELGKILSSLQSFHRTKVIVKCNCRRDNGLIKTEKLDIKFE